MKFTRSMAHDLRTGFLLADRFRRESRGVGETTIISERDPTQAEAIIIVDDMFDTCGSLAAVCRALHERAPQARLYGIAPHGYFSGEAHLNIRKLVSSCALEWIAVTNSIGQTGALERF